MLFFGGYALNSLIQCFVPEFTISSAQARRHSSNQLYEEHLIKMARMDGRGARVVVAGDKEIISANPLEKIPSDASLYTPISQEELTQKRKASWELEIYLEKRSGLKRFVSESVTIIIALFILLLHWRLANRQKQRTHQASGTP